ncbi:hypothetical protein PPL_00191 [Heterostelium album PN500]|uniref:Acyl-coenzyme A thioesterase 13 n=1 Tax=Heterostelium pallidum (strain ATCC 26659 / Pp 5 / PN500) TaxID=670386 RepID=D3AVS6_HETP5|nr:hypothetical protein PPL_00191 [Heterostelium album PN500]EFA86399.1 hypothetical protein PPL_00191 [Heterostelium album PN500]|eukprot:XP_020438504.1 hypothetical protein PPL_00191 [Heterostelium album PN500]
MSKPQNIKEKEEALFKLLDQWKGLTGFDSVMFKYLKMESIDHEKNSIIMSMTVPQELCNVLSTLHGGAMATLVDIVSSIAIISTDPSNMPPSVSVDLSISYAATAPLGETITIESLVYKIGKNLAFSDTTIYNSKKKKITQKHKDKIFANT